MKLLIMFEKNDCLILIYYDTRELKFSLEIEYLFIPIEYLIISLLLRLLELYDQKKNERP